MRKKVNIQISAGCFLLVVMMLIILPIQWVFAIITAAMVHELFHMIVICLCGGNILSISITCRGAVIETQELEAHKELLCAIAGPLGSVMLLMLFPFFPRLALCGVIHCLFNLLPLYPLDGGRMLRCLIYICFHPRKSDKIWKWSQFVICIALVLLIAVFTVKSQSYMLFISIFLLRRLGEEKALANGRVWRYNRRSMKKGYHYDRIETADSPKGSKTCPLYWRRV